MANKNADGKMGTQTIGKSTKTLEHIQTGTTHFNQYIKLLNFSVFEKLETVRLRRYRIYLIVKMCIVANYRHIQTGMHQKSDT